MSTPAATPEAASLSAVYKAAGDPSRLRLLALLAHGELCVCHLVDALEAPQPFVSRHLGVLRRAGLVWTRRDGPWVHYVLSDAAQRWLAPALATWRADASLAATHRALRACG
jgi:ArsR family transcriptional regulator, arsenate/arsenite/antimonite-responsive transcriptional repressor